MAKEIMGAAEILGLDDLLGADVVLGDDLLGYDGDIMGAYNELLGAYVPPDQMRQQMAMQQQAQAVARQQAYNRQQAPARRPAARQQAMAPYQQGGNSAVLAQLAARHGAAVSDVEPSKSRQWTVGFDSVANVLAGATATLITNPQCVFRPERLVIGGAIAASFLVNDIRVGKDSQILNATAIPGDAFLPTAVNTPLRLDTCQVSQQLVLVVTNVSLAALRFNAVMFGTAIQ